MKNDEPIDHYIMFMQYCIKLALTIGWQVGEEYSGARVLLDKRHESSNWCAEWRNYTVDGVVYHVPHWLPRVVLEQVEGLVKNQKV